MVFLAFAAVFFCLWPKFRIQNQSRWIFLITASFFFYGWWDPRFILLILASGLLNYWASRAMRRWPGWKKCWLITSIAGNIGSLVVFKYLAFITETVNQSLNLLGWSSTLPVVSLTLPIGISFYTFQSMSYTLDVYHGRLEPTKSIAHYLAYLSLFPHLLAGPIVRASELLPQIAKHTIVSEADRFEGTRLIIHGFFKKVVIADSLAPVINTAFSGQSSDASGVYWWIISAMFAAQIYCDFSGYSDIARGLFRWMGYDVAVNFNHPYLANSFSDFWNRWHMSLSSWFRDYVFAPLSKSTHSMSRNYANLWITMMVSGLWHGASWTFVFWGALHALYLSIEKLTRWPRRLRRLPFGRLMITATLLIQVLIAWVFFRSESWSQALNIVLKMINVFAWNRQDLVHLDPLAGCLLLLLICRELYVFFCPRLLQALPHQWERIIQPIALGGVVGLCVFLRGPGNAFIYSQF